MKRNKIFEIRIMINNNLDSIKEYAESAYLYFTRLEVINEPDEIMWGLSSITEYIDDTNQLTEEYEEEYEKMISEKVENIHRDSRKLLSLEMNLQNYLDKIKKYGEDGYQYYIDSEYISKSKVLDELLFISKSIDIIIKILDEIEITYEKEYGEYYE